MTTNLQLFIDRVLVPALIERLEEHTDLTPRVVPTKAKDLQPADIDGASARNIGKVPEAA